MPRSARRRSRQAPPRAFDPADPAARKAVLAATGGVHAACDFVGSETSLAFATGVLAKGGKVVVTGLLGGAFSTAVAMFPIKAMTIEGTLTGTLAEARSCWRWCAAAPRCRCPFRASAGGKRNPRSTTCAPAGWSGAWC